MYKKYLEVAWMNVTEFVPLDLNSLSENIQITSTLEEWPAADDAKPRTPHFVNYKTYSQVERRGDGGFVVRITYKHDNNLHIQYEDALWGVSTIVIPQGAHSGEASWKGVDTEKYDGTVQWTWRDKEEEKRTRSSKTVVDRNQLRFRHALLSLDKCCGITGETTERALEAAHIVPVAEDGMEWLENGILLRADLHRLYDKHLFTIQPDGKVKLQGELSDAYIELLKDKRLPTSVLIRVKAALEVANSLAQV
ncbi:HNH endonuclease signature motif containing protein [Chromobacterium rhizoryzae]|uniref:HNH endonuclease signature motif containing protein n=1 Tax=Chromobacterium rhizoryzae TaxID=1778675 RepID=UPI001D06C482|nr:HNH endonuclease signature motif containing protein [Chromobacterium rhizoryzae]